MSNELSIVNPPKALIALVGLLCITVLMITKTIPTEAGVGLLSFVLGYAVGNGVAAKEGHQAGPMIGRRE